MKLLEFPLIAAVRRLNDKLTHRENERWQTRSKLFGGLAVVAAMSSPAGVVHAVTLAEWQTVPSTANPVIGASVVDPALSADGLSAGAGITANNGGTWNWRGWDTASTSFDDAVAAEDFWSWGFDVSSGNVTPQSMDIRVDRSGSGPDDLEIQVSVNGGPAISLLTHDFNDSSAGVDFVGVDLTSLGVLSVGDSVVFTLAAFNAESSGGTFDLETVGFNTDDPRSLRIEGSLDGVVEDLAPIVVSSTPVNGATQVAVDANILITFSEAVTVTPGVWFDIDCSISGNNLGAVEASGDSTTFTLEPLSTFAPGEECTVNVVASEVSDLDGTPDNLASDFDFAFTIASEALNPSVFINEFHYDDSGSDDGEFVEVAGVAGTNLTGWSLVLYNGNSGGVYATIDLAGTLGDDTGTGFGFLSFNQAGIQNGSPDGIALIDGSNGLVQFLSYEGSFVASDGPASGATSEDIGVFEPGTTPEGRSLQLMGEGTRYGDFIWASPDTATAGCSNNNQTFDGAAAQCEVELSIAEIQGSGVSSPVETSKVLTSGVVIGDFQGVPGSADFHPDQLEGFFIQDPVGDADASTSDGIFVFCDTCETDVNVGDLVSVAGTVVERFGLTSVDVSAGLVEVISGQNPLPEAALVDLPIASRDDLEPFEAMLVTFTDTLSVGEYFQLGRFGEVVLFEGGNPYQFTHDNFPSVSGVESFEAELDTRRIILDDDANGQNQALFQDLNVFYPRPGLSTDNFFRGGDSITGLTGVLDFSFGEYRVRPVVEAFDYTFQNDNPRTEAPEDVGGNLRVVGANVLNFFTTIDVTSSNSSGDCSPSQTLDCRGADSAAELVRQQQKLVAALCTMDGHIVGLSEIENDAAGSASLQTLVSALNAADCGVYDFVDAGPIGTDAIKVAFLYQPEVVLPVDEQTFIVDDSIDANYRDTRNRPTLIQTFATVAGGERLIVAAHHLKSKGSDCDELGDPDLNDGQGNCSQTRALAAGIVRDYIANTVIPEAETDRVLVIGDLNAYKREDAVLEFTGAGYVDLIEAFNGDDAYSFVFGGQRGYLDHALGLNLTDVVTDVTEWHINADEINLLDYNDDIRDEGEASFEEKPDNLPLFDAGPFRSSDHDPVIIGLELASSGDVDGDLDGDGDVDVADYRAFLGVYRQAASVSAVAAEADYNGNGVVDLNDFAIWQGFYRTFVTSS